MPGQVSGLTIAYTAVGGAVLWSGITGTSLTTTARDVLAGQAPSQDQEPVGTAAAGGAAAAPAATGASSATAAANQATAKILAAPLGWSAGTQWSDLVALWNQESGWNDKAVNPSSGATGIPQLLPSAHAVPPGWSSPSVQIGWGLSYIAARYGSPAAAWAHEQQFGWY